LALHKLCFHPDFVALFFFPPGASATRRWLNCELEATGVTGGEALADPYKRNYGIRITHRVM
jgi:hypothetical protein